MAHFPSILASRARAFLIGCHCPSRNVRNRLYISGASAIRRALAIRSVNGMATESADMAAMTPCFGALFSVVTVALSLGYTIIVHGPGVCWLIGSLLSCLCVFTLATGPSNSTPLVGERGEPGSPSHAR